MRQTGDRILEEAVYRVLTRHHLAEIAQRAVAAFETQAHHYDVWITREVKLWPRAERSLRARALLAELQEDLVILERDVEHRAIDVARYEADCRRFTNLKTFPYLYDIYHQRLELFQTAIATWRQAIKMHQDVT